MALIRHLAQLAADMRSLYRFYRRNGYSKARALQIAVTCDGQTKAAAACMAVLCLAVACAIAWAFGPYGGLF